MHDNTLTLNPQAFTRAVTFSHPHLHPHLHLHLHLQPHPHTFVHPQAFHEKFGDAWAERIEVQTNPKPWTFGKEIFMPPKEAVRYNLG